MLPKEIKIIVSLQIITVIGFVTLWTLYAGSAPGNTPVVDSVEYRFLYDHATPIPDIVVGACLLLAAFLLFKRKNAGRIVSMLISIYLIFLGIIDFTLPVSGLRYAISIIDVSSRGVLNLWCIVLGLYSLIKLRRISFDKASVVSTVD